jgi:hypothetical protein
VRLIEENDPRIEQGMADYQQSLEVFVGKTLANYESCEIFGDKLKTAEKMECLDGSAEARLICDDVIAAEITSLAISVEESCSAARYDTVREEFYIEQEARLSVMKTRAAVLDSMGICVRAMNGVAKATSGVLPAAFRGAINVDDVQSANNCTAIIVNAVFENHQEMGLNHRCIDDPTYQLCPDQYKSVDPSTWNSAMQAGFYFPIMLETLQQNIRIVLFLEEAKKRGSQNEEE